MCRRTAMWQRSAVDRFARRRSKRCAIWRNQRAFCALEWSRKIVGHRPPVILGLVCASRLAKASWHCKPPAQLLSSALSTAELLATGDTAQLQASTESPSGHSSILNHSTRLVEIMASTNVSSCRLSGNATRDLSAKRSSNKTNWFVLTGETLRVVELYIPINNQTVMHLSVCRRAII